MTRSNVRNEARHFWRLMHFTKTGQANNDQAELADLADEFDVLREMTDWLLLKERCSKMLAELHPEQQIA